VTAGDPRGTARRRMHQWQIGLLVPVALVLIGAALKATATLTMPLAFAVFLAILLEPVRHRVDTATGLRGLGVVAAMVVLVAVIAVFAGGLWASWQLVADGLPAYRDDLAALLERLRTLAADHGITVPDLDEMDGDAATDGEAAAPLMNLITAIGQRIASLALMIPSVSILIFFFVLLMLLEGGAWQRKMHLLDDSRNRLRTTVRTISIKMRQYLWIRALVSLISGLAAGTWLWAMSVDFFYLWGFLTFILNFVPTIGSVVSVVLPTGMALLQFDPGYALLVFLGLLAIEQVIGNVIDPMLQGNRLDLSPLLVLISIIFWGWVWGIPGALIGVPLTVALMIVCAHFEVLLPVALLMSGSGDRRHLIESTSPGTGPDGPARDRRMEESPAE